MGNIPIDSTVSFPLKPVISNLNHHLEDASGHVSLKKFIETVNSSYLVKSKVEAKTIGPLHHFSGLSGKQVCQDNLNELVKDTFLDSFSNHSYEIITPHSVMFLGRLQSVDQLGSFYNLDPLRSASSTPSENKSMGMEFSLDPKFGNKMEECAFLLVPRGVTLFGKPTGGVLLLT